MWESDYHFKECTGRYETSVKNYVGSACHKFNKFTVSLEKVVILKSAEDSYRRK